MSQLKSSKKHKVCQPKTVSAVSKALLVWWDAVCEEAEEDLTLGPRLFDDLWYESEMGQIDDNIKSHTDGSFDSCSERHEVSSFRTSSSSSGPLAAHEEDDFGPEIDPKAAEHEVSQPSLLPTRDKKLHSHLYEVPKVAHWIMYRLCFLAETESEALLISSPNRGIVASVLGRLRDAGADLSQLNRFEDWWNQDWHSRDKLTGSYQPPRPNQVLDFWTIAMKHKIYKPKPSASIEPRTAVIDLASIMRNRAETRK